MDHAARRREMLKSHPELRQLMGTNPWTAALIGAIVLAQSALALAFAGSPAWLWLTASYLVGPWLCLGLFGGMHEAIHKLVFKGRVANRAVTLLCNLPMIVPFAVTFGSFHLIHHRDLGIPGRDVDLPTSLEARWVGGSPFRKALWLLLFPVIYTVRATIARVKPAEVLDRWWFVNVALQAVYITIMYRLGGGSAVAYLLLSAYFSVSLHPLSGRWIQEHFLLFGNQQTTSYYGFCNRFSFNCGFHVEHHDVASIPWNRLRELKRIAPEHYETVGSVASWSSLVVRFLSDREFGLDRRLIQGEAS